jgi:hypothetical protein
MLVALAATACGEVTHRATGHPPTTTEIGTTLPTTVSRTVATPPSPPAPHPKRHAKHAQQVQVQPTSASMPLTEAAVRRQTIAALRRQLYHGNLAFNAPTSLQLNESAEIALVVGQASTQSLKKILPNNGVQQVARQVDLSSRMEAKLTGIDFHIQLETARVQTVGVLTTTQWRWQIEPTHTGQQQLHLTLNALLHSGGSTQAVTIRTFDRTIPITVTFDQRVASFFSTNWHWFISTLLLPLAVYAWRKRRKADSEAAPEGPKTPLQS